MRVALFAASPVYSRSPLHRLVAADPRVDLTAIFASDGGIRPFDGGYGRPVSWGMGVLDGYKYSFLRRASTNPIDGSFLSFRDLDVVSALRATNFDVLWLWGYNYLTHQIAAFTAVSARKPIIFHENQTLLDPRPRWKSALKKLALPMLFRQGRALYVGKENFRWFRHYGVPEDRLYFAPYSVDNDRLQEASRSLAPERESLRRALGIRADSGPVILFVGRLIPKKQPDLLLEAFRRVRAETRCTLVYVGSGELEDRMRRAVSDQNIPDVVMRGFIDQAVIGRAYACADIFVLPSRGRETWGLAVNEAMNFGLPILVSDRVGCASDLVDPGGNGYIVNYADTGDFARRLRTLVADASLRRQFGDRSRQLIERWNYRAATEGVIKAIGESVGPLRWKTPASVATEVVSV